jgi:hypothetical protein
MCELIFSFVFFEFFCGGEFTSQDNTVSHKTGKRQYIWQNNKPEYIAYRSTIKFPYSPHLATDKERNTE